MKPVCEVYQQKQGRLNKMQAKKQKWSWRLIGGNTQIVATPRKAWTKMEEARANALDCKDYFRLAMAKNIKVTGHDDKWRWSVRLIGGDKVYPHQSFTTERGAYKSLQRVNRIFRVAKVKVKKADG